MNRIFKLKNIIFGVLICCIMWSGGSKVNAQIEREVEPNNIKEEAHTMQENRETAAQVIEANRTGQFVIDGYIDNADED